MNNPNYPRRKIRHADLLLKAGFRIDRGWMSLEKKNPSASSTCGCARLIYWTHPKERITVTFFDTDLVSVETLVTRCIKQAVYNCQKKARIVFDD